MLLTCNNVIANIYLVEFNIPDVRSKCSKVQEE